MLMTASGDGKLKTWDISGGKPSLVHDLQQNLGALLCLDACPDLPFVACVGGENKRRNFAVIDVMDISAGEEQRVLRGTHDFTSLRIGTSSRN
jgi:WD40 repeat protein